jgi:hypothetical protein
MKVSFRQSGGYAGITMGCDLDTASMPEEDAAHLRELVERADVARLKEALSPDRAPDAFTYELTIERPSGALRLTFDDKTKPEGLADLLSFVRKCSTPLPAD